MNQIKAEGIVTKEVNFGEADKILTILTKEHGKITAFAAGVRRHRSKLIAGCAHLAFSEFTLIKTTKMYKVTGASPIEVFYPLRENLDALCFATYFAELANELTEENVKSYDIIRLLLNSLYMVSEKKLSPYLAKTIFELRAMCIAGFAPNIKNCLSCEEEKNDVWFSAHEGDIFCNDCAAGNMGYVHLPEAVYAALLHICFSSDNKLFSFNVAEGTLKFLNELTESYVRIHIGKEFSSLTYLKKLLNYEF